eukprot:1161446-Pelagomonas_calceolata.AAC.19
MAANFAIHFRDYVLPLELARIVPSIPEGCIQPSAILKGQWMRLIWSAFLHLDDSHVYYNMASLLVKGRGFCVEQEKWRQGESAEI